MDGSSWSRPAMDESSSETSAADRAIGPAWSRVHTSGMTPYALTRPNVGFSDVMPLAVAGRRSDPPVSVPVAAGTIRAPSTAPDPPLEPPGERAGSHGLPLCGVATPKANSSVCAWPSRTMPWCFSCDHTVLSPVATLPSSTLDDAVSGRPLAA